MPAGAGVFVRDCDLEQGFIVPRPDPMVVQRVDEEGRILDPMHFNHPCLSACCFRLLSGREVLLVLEPVDHEEKKWARIRVVRDLQFEGETTIGFPSVNEGEPPEYVIDQNSGDVALLQCSEQVEWLRSGPYVYIINGQPPDVIAGQAPTSNNHKAYQLDLRDMLGSGSACEDWPVLRHACIYKGFIVGGNGTSVYWSDPQTGTNLYTWTEAYHDTITGGLGDSTQKFVVFRDKVFVLTALGIWYYDGLPTQGSWRKSRIAEIGTLDPGSVQVVESRGGGGWIYYLGSDGSPRRTDGTFHNIQVVGGFVQEGQSPVKKTVAKYHSLAAVGGGRIQSWTSATEWAAVSFVNTFYNLLRGGVTLEYDLNTHLTREKQEGFGSPHFEWVIPNADNPNKVWQEFITTQDEKDGDPFYKGMLLSQIDIGVRACGTDIEIRVRVCKRPPKAVPRGVWDSLTLYEVKDGVTYSGTSYICLVVNRGYPPEPGGNTYWREYSESEVHTNYDHPVAEGTFKVTGEGAGHHYRWGSVTLNKIFADMRVNTTDFEGYNLYLTQVGGEGYALLQRRENWAGQSYPRGDVWRDGEEEHEEFCTTFRVYSGAYQNTELTVQSGTVQSGKIELEEGEVIGDLYWSHLTAGEHDSALTGFNLYVSVDLENWIDITDDGPTVGLTNYLPATTQFFYFRCVMSRTHPAYSPNLRSVIFYPRVQASLPENAITSLMWRDKYILCLQRNPEVAEDTDLSWSEAPPLRYERQDSEVGRDMLIFEPAGAWTLWDNVGAGFAVMMHDRVGLERLVYVDCKDTHQNPAYDPVDHPWYTPSVLLLILAETRRDLTFRPARPAFITGAITLVDSFDTGRILRMLVSYRQCRLGGAATLAIWSWTAGGTFGRWRNHSIPVDGQPGFRNYPKRLASNNGRWAMMAVGVDIDGDLIKRVQLPIEVQALGLEVEGAGPRTGTTDGSLPRPPHEI